MWPRRPTERHCQLLGAALADLHVKGRDFAMQRPNNLSLAGWQSWRPRPRRARDEVEAGAGRADRGRAAPSGDALAAGAGDRRHPCRPVPRQRVLPRRQAVGPDRLLFRLHRFPRLRPRGLHQCLVLRGRRLVQRHQGAADGARLRFAPQLPEAEIAALPILARGSALRFLLTRLYDWLNHPPGALVTAEGPAGISPQAGLPPAVQVGAGLRHLMTSNKPPARSSSRSSPTAPAAAIPARAAGARSCAMAASRRK